MKAKTIFTLILLCAIGSALADSLHVSLAGLYYPGYGAGDVYVCGDYAYVVGYDFGRVVDVTEPTTPRRFGAYTTGSHPYSIHGDGDYIYLADGEDGLRIIDISTPSTPIEVSLYNTGSRTYGVYVSSDYAYVTGDSSSLRIIDVSTPSSPVEVGFFNTSTAYHPPYKVFVSGGYAFLANGSIGLRIIDVSMPSSPNDVGFFDTEVIAWDIHVSGNYAYIADGHDGLRIIDITIPSSPLEVGFYDSLHVALGVYVSGNYAYVIDNYLGLRVIDVSTPSHPTEVGFYDECDYPYGVYVSGSYAYVADRGEGLLILDVSYFTGIEEKPSAKPEVFAISAHPNPFNSAVTITAPAGAEVEVFDVNGRRIAVIARPEAAAISPNQGDCFVGQSPPRNDGVSKFTWRPAESLGSGVYLVRATVGGESITKRMVYLK